MHLIYVNEIGSDYKGQNQYEFVFSETTEIDMGEWFVIPASSSSQSKSPDIEYVDVVGLLKNTDLQLELIQNSDYFGVIDDGAEEAGDDLTHDLEGEHDMGGEEAATKGDVMDLADKLDELMAEFESMMGGGDDMGGNDMGDDMGEIEVDADEFETEGMMENITLKQVHPKTTTHEEGDGKAGPVAFNAGQTGMAGRPVKAGQAEGGHHDTAAYKNTTKDLIGKVGNSPAQAKQDLKPATKPHLGQATGVNTRTPFPKGK